MKKKNFKHINEMSPEFLDRAIKRQEHILNNKYEIRKLSAWQLLRSMKRLSDFKDYYQTLVDRVNSGAIGTPEDPVPTKKEVTQVLQDTKQQAGTPVSSSPAQGASVSTPASSTANSAKYADVLTPEERKKFLRSPEAKTARRGIKYTKPTVDPSIKNLDEYKEGKYIVRYISFFDDDTCSVWCEATSKQDAIDNTIRSFYDVKHIQEVIFEGEDEEVVDNEPVIDISDYNSLGEVGNAIATEVTGGEFNTFPELVADIKDDKTTEECDTGSVYSGTDLNGNPWSGHKSSYREILDEDGDYTSTNDHDIKIVTVVDENGNDQFIDGTFNKEAFKAALREGIVHFVFEKVLKKGETVPQLRQAFGTTNAAILQSVGIGSTDPTAAGQRVNNSTVPYYDMTSGGWRSFKIGKLKVIYDESYVVFEEK